MDIATALSHYGVGELGKMIRLAILFSSIGVMAAATLLRDKMPWYLYLVIGSGCLVLVSPRTENPTFVLMGPTYIFLTAVIFSYSKSWSRHLALGILYSGIFFITISYNDIWPKSLWNPHLYTNICKTFGALILWVLGMACLIRQWVNEFIWQPSPAESAA